MREKSKTILATISTGCLLSLIIFLVIMRQTAQPPFRFFNVLTESMTPTIPPGSLVVVQAIAPEELTVGEVITYRLDEQQVTHRIVQRLEQNGNVTFITRGDANATDDFLPVNKTQIIGKLLFSLPKAGRFGEMLMTRNGTIALCLSSLQLWLLSDWFRLCRQLLHEQKQDVLEPN